MSTTPRSPRLRRLLGSLALFAAVIGIGLGLASWKRESLAGTAAAAASQPEPVEVVEASVVGRRDYQRSTTAIGTVLALRSVTLRNEVAGTVREVHLETGAVVEEGALLVGLDVAVEEAELAAARAQLALAETLLGRIDRAQKSQGASASDVDRARAERDVAAANVLRIEAMIDRKLVRAPFRARIGLSDVHEGQYLDVGTALTTLQGVDEAVHVDFMVPQDVARALGVGASVEVVDSAASTTFAGRIIGIDARVDERTRNASLRARVESAERLPAPGGSVRVRVPIGNPAEVFVVPVSALRKGPSGEHVFVIADDDAGVPRARLRRVDSGAVLGDEVVVLEGLERGERVASSGSFKLFDGMRVAVPPPAPATSAEVR